jgi:hypothetical protein
MLWRRRGDYVSNGDIEMVSERPKGLTREAIEVYPVSVYGISNCTFTTPSFIPIDSQKDSTSISIDAPSLPLSLTLTAHSRFKNPDAGSKYNGGGAGSMYYLQRRFVISLF